MTDSLLTPSLFIASLLMACTIGPRAGGPLEASGSGIEGEVLIGPMCPTVQQGQLCPDKPFAATLVVQDRHSGCNLLSVRSGKDGRFRLNLAPGEYTLIPLSPKPGAPPYAGPQLVTVESQRYTPVTVKYDSGIR